MGCVTACWTDERKDEGRDRATQRMCKLWRVLALCAHERAHGKCGNQCTHQNRVRGEKRRRSLRLPDATRSSFKPARIPLFRHENIVDEQVSANQITIGGQGRRSSREELVARMSEISPAREGVAIAHTTRWDWQTSRAPSHTISTYELYSVRNLAMYKSRSEIKERRNYDIVCQARLGTWYRRKGENTDTTCPASPPLGERLEHNKGRDGVQ